MTPRPRPSLTVHHSELVHEDHITNLNPFDEHISNPKNHSEVHVDDSWTDIGASKLQMSPHSSKVIVQENMLDDVYAIYPHSTSKKKKLRILDCRALISAQGNTIMGKGFENITRLGGKEKVFIYYYRVYSIEFTVFSPTGHDTVCKYKKYSYHERQLSKAAKPTSKNILVQ
jgi:hypothetical protein